MADAVQRVRYAGVIPAKVYGGGWKDDVAYVRRSFADAGMFIPRADAIYVWRAIADDHLRGGWPIPSGFSRQEIVDWAKPYIENDSSAPDPVKDEALPPSPLFGLIFDFPTQSLRPRRPDETTIRVLAMSRQEREESGEVEAEASEKKAMIATVTPKKRRGEITGKYESRAALEAAIKALYGKPTKEIAEEVGADYSFVYNLIPPEHRITGKRGRAPAVGRFDNREALVKYVMENSSQDHAALAVDVGVSMPTVRKILMDNAAA